MNKYKNKKRYLQGYTFDSIKEANRFLYLQNEERKGFITCLKVHPKYKLFDSDKTLSGEAIRPLKYTADFEYVKDGKKIVEDVKPFDKRTKKYLLTKDFRLRINLFKRLYKDLNFTLV